MSPASTESESASKPESTPKAEAKKKNPEETTDCAFQSDVLVPSRGRFDGEKLPEGKVTLRPISVPEEKMFLSSKTQMAVADKVLDKCIVSACPPVNELLMTDKYFLLLNLRSISYGPEYSFKMKCGSCKKDFNHTVVLPDGLSLKIATEEDVEPFDVTLPICGKVLSLRFLRGTDEEEIDNYVSQLEGVNPDDGDPGYEYRLTRHIVLIDGEEVDALKKLNFVKTMIGRDSLAMRRSIAEHETGIDFGLNLTCPSCMQNITTSLPLTNEFFPTSVS